MILSTNASVLIDVDPKQVDVTDMPNYRAEAIDQI